MYALRYIHFQYLSMYLCILHDVANDAGYIYTSVIVLMRQVTVSR